MLEQEQCMKRPNKSQLIIKKEREKSTIKNIRIKKEIITLVKIDKVKEITTHTRREMAISSIAMIIIKEAMEE